MVLPPSEKPKAEQSLKADDTAFSGMDKGLSSLEPESADVQCEQKTATICEDAKNVMSMQECTEHAETKENQECAGLGEEKRTASVSKQRKALSEKEWDDLFAAVIEKYSYKNSQEMEEAQVRHEAELLQLQSAAEECGKAKVSSATSKKKPTKVCKKDMTKAVKQKKKPSLTDCTIEAEDPEAAGTWVQCSSTSCLKWRHLPDCEDPSLLPDHWTCCMNPDKNYSSCSIPEVDFDEEEHEAKFIFTRFTEGSIVWAKLPGWPWWPAMVEADPDLGCCMDIPYGSKVPAAFHVVFFDDKVSRAWVQAASIDQFDPDESMDTHGPFKVRSTNHTKAVTAALLNAKEAYGIPLKERVAKCGFKVRFKGKIAEYQWDSNTEPESVMTDDELQELSSDDLENVLGSAELIVKDAQKVISDLLSSDNSPMEYEELLECTLKKEGNNSNLKEKPKMKTKAIQPVFKPTSQKGKPSSIKVKSDKENSPEQGTWESVINSDTNEDIHTETKQDASKTKQGFCKKEKLRIIREPRILKAVQPSAKPIKKMSKFTAPLAKPNAELEQSERLAMKCGSSVSKRVSKGSMEASEKSKKYIAHKVKRITKKGIQFSRLEDKVKPSEEPTLKTYESKTIRDSTKADDLSEEQEVPQNESVEDGYMSDEMSNRSSQSEDRCQELKILSTSSNKTSKNAEQAKSINKNDLEVMKSDHRNDSQLNPNNMQRTGKKELGIEHKTKAEKKEYKKPVKKYNGGVELGKIKIRSNQNQDLKDSDSELDLEMEENLAVKEKVQKTKKYLKERPQKRKASVMSVSKEESDQQLGLDLKLSPQQQASTSLSPPKRSKKVTNVTDSEEEQEELDLHVDAAATETNDAAEAQAAENEDSDFDFTEE